MVSMARYTVTSTPTKIADVNDARATVRLFAWSTGAYIGATSSVTPGGAESTQCPANNALNIELTRGDELWVVSDGSPTLEVLIQS